MSKVYALSIKQPWAALVVHGLKTIEVRRWLTARRGRILIHAARVPDERPQGWKRVPDELKTLARQYGGILGAVELTDCRAYRSGEAFAADFSHHLNEPEWFLPPLLYGFCFEAPEVLPFHPYAGWMRFFPVEWDGPNGDDQTPPGSSP